MDTTLAINVGTYVLHFECKIEQFIENAMIQMLQSIIYLDT